MLHVNFLLCCCLLSLQVLFAQTLVSHFDWEEGKKALVYPLPTGQAERPMQLVTLSKNQISLFTFDPALNLVDRVDFDPLPYAVAREAVLAVNDQGEQIQLIFDSPETPSKVVAVNLIRAEKRYFFPQVDLLPATSPYPQERLLLNFIHQRKFYQLYVHRRNKELIVTSLGLGFEVETHRFSLKAHPKLASWLLAEAVVPIPVVREGRDRSITTLAKEEKFYLQGDQLMLSSELPEGKGTHWFTFDLNTGTQTHQLVKGIATDKSMRGLKGNSCWYQDRLYQLLYGPKIGLKLAATDLKTGQVVLEKTWATDSALSTYLPQRAGFDRPANPVLETPHHTMDAFDKFPAIVVDSLAGGETVLRLGAHHYMTAAQRRGLSLMAGYVSGMLSWGGFMGSTGGYFYDPLPTFDSGLSFLVDLGLRSMPGRVYEVYGTVDPEDLEPQPGTVPEPLGARVIDFLDETELKEGKQAVTSFELAGELYLGYWDADRYYFLRIEAD